jgi:hypothetical protein
VSENKPISTKGYARVAHLMARSNTGDLAIFRKFGELNMLNLLRLQAELQFLHDKLRVAYEKDQGTLHSQYSFEKMREHDPEAFQYDDGPAPFDSDNDDYCPTAVHTLFKRIEKKLKAYST